MSIVVEFSLHEKITLFLIFENILILLNFANRDSKVSVFKIKKFKDISSWYIKVNKISEI